MNRLLTILIVLIINTQYCFGADNDVVKISLNEALNLAFHNNLDIKSARMNVDTAKNTIKTANKLQNPDFVMFFNIGPAGRTNANEIGVLQIIELGKRTSRKNLAKSNYELAQKNAAFAEFVLRMEIRQAYVALVASKTVLKKLEEQKQLISDLYNITKKRVKNRAAPETELMQMEIALNQIVTQINRARANVEKQKYQFNSSLNIKNPKIIYDANDEDLSCEIDFVNLMTPKPTEILPDFQNIYQKALSKRYDLKIAKQEIDVAEKNLTKVLRQRIPDMLVSGGYAYQSKSHSIDDRFLNGAYAGGAITNIPLLYSYDPEIKNAKILLTQSQTKYESVENKAVNELKSTYKRFLISQENLNYYNKNLIKKTEEMMKISKKNYETGNLNLISLIVIEQSYRAIFADYISALAEYYICWIEFLQEVNDEEIELYG